MLAPSRDLEFHDDGRVLVGGHPWRVMRLSGAGQRAVARWLAGDVPTGDAEVLLAQRCVDAGMLFPGVPTGASDGMSCADVTVVIPVRDRVEGLQQVLDALAPAGVECIVVDDGSCDGEAHAAVTSRAGARLIRRDHSGGPSAARNDGLAQVATPFVCFVDSDVCLDAAALRRLRWHMDDPSLDAVAPRVRHRPAAGTSATVLERYEDSASPLDLGSHPSPIRPGARVTYVPAAVLMMRTDSCRRLGGFDTAMQVGEDVDLLWRLHADEGRALYDPGAIATHASRTSWGAALERRVAYGTSAAALHERHGGLVAPVRVFPTTVALVGTFVAGRPFAGLAAVGVTTMRMTRQLAARLDGVDAAEPIAARAVVRGQLGGLRQVARSVLRPYAPLAAVGMMASRRLRRVVGLATVTTVAVEYLERAPDLDPLRWGLAWVADEVAYSAGVWKGAVTARNPGALLPVANQD